MSNNELTIEPKVQKSIKSVVKYAQDAAITNEQEMVKASEFVKTISSLKKAVEDQRTQFTKPLNQSLKNINAFFKKFSEPLEEADNVLRQKLVACKNVLLEDQNQFGEIHFTTTTKIEVVDLKKVPFEYLKLDEAKVQKAILSGVTNIKGLSIVKDKKVSL